MSAGVKLSEGQRAAVGMSAVERVMVLTGGPGCGKTFATKAIVAHWKKSMPRAKILLCAPTGALQSPSCN